ncbi:predicted protein [Micromonas commoda]|uniref:Uncharacterized protein n=1 Tax=Micromonas commoda (strain RCC299 / NOUM17 / CCMP2709) TaxID=296587 RepID=C1EFS9_MICCC|nr:predicted protein [Micromonas commoda]ACO66905.1 predicted protein [Micromonas commoda]|eukprot:XP_002505647.1 predicted protein [Micromonas commoda]
MDKKDAELAELRALVAKLRGEASEAQRERSKAEAKAWEWRRALRVSEKAAKDAAGLLRRRDETHTEELKRRENSVPEKTPEPRRTSWVPPGRTSVTSPKRTPPRASPRSSTRSVLSTPPSATRRSPGAAGGDEFGGGVLDPKPHPSTVESARLEAEELATRRRVREETGVDVFAPFGSPPAVDRDVAYGSRSTPSRRQLHLRSPHKPLAADAETASLRTECASLRIENERLARDVARWRAEAAAVADQARESERSTFTREQRRLEKALADADSKNRVLATEAKTLRDSRDDALASAVVQAGTEARVLRDELEAVSADLEGSRRDLSAAIAREDALQSRLAAHEIQLANYKSQSASAPNDDVDKERITRANARIAELTNALGEVEDERFELRRALEAHVTALVEAKVDSAELAGTVAELRKELARVNVRYQRAAARCAKMEAREVRGDAVARVGHRGSGRVGDDAANSPA